MNAISNGLGRLAIVTVVSMTACSNGAAVAAGEELYSEQCVACHGANGGGEAESGYPDAPPLDNTVPGLTDEALVDLIIEGQGGMPPVPVSDDEALDIVAYLRATF